MDVSFTRQNSTVFSTASVEKNNNNNKQNPQTGTLDTFEYSLPGCLVLAVVMFPICRLRLCTVCITKSRHYLALSVFVRVCLCADRTGRKKRR